MAKAAAKLLRDEWHSRLARLGSRDLVQRELRDDLDQGRLAWAGQDLDGVVHEKLKGGFSWATAVINWEDCSASFGAVRYGPATGIVMPGQRKPSWDLEAIRVRPAKQRPKRAEDGVERLYYDILLLQMKASPQHRPKPKSEYWKACHEKHGGPERAFLRAWKRAVHDSKSTWDHPGRAKQSSQS